MTKTDERCTKPKYKIGDLVVYKDHEDEDCGDMQFNQGIIIASEGNIFDNGGDFFWFYRMDSSINDYDDGLIEEVEIVEKLN